MISHRIPDMQELADSAWSAAEDVLKRIVGPSELFGHLANWQGAEIGADLT